MLRAVRSRSTPSHGVRLRSLLAAWLAISSGLLAATRVNAGAIERLAANPDSVASKPSAVPGTFQGSTTTTAAPPSSTVPRYSSTPVKPQKHDNYSLHLHGGLLRCHRIGVNCRPHDDRRSSVPLSTVRTVPTLNVAIGPICPEA